MKIDMSKATLEWLEKWKAAKLATPQGSFYNRVEITQPEAFRQYITDKLDVYLTDFRVSDREVTFYKSDLYRDDLKKLMRTEFVLKDGIAVFDEIDTDTYYEAYCDEPSVRLELTFRIQK